MADDVILETRGLTKEFKGFVAVQNLAEDPRAAASHADRAKRRGKTTCFNLLTHFLEPRGQIFYNGREITGSSPASTLMGLVRSFQISAVPTPVLENVHRAAAQARRLVHSRAPRVCGRAQRQGAELIEAVGLGEFAPPPSAALRAQARAGIATTLASIRR
jgi:branched-chain amino acid transport system ATP-binding protein